MTAAIATPHIDWLALAPVNALLAAAALALLCSVLVPSASRKPVTAALCALHQLAGANAAPPTEWSQWSTLWT